MLHCAIVGSGPAGFFCADLLSKKLPDCQIDLLERLPTPYGLVRAGVAPDHPGTKNITRQFERVLSRPSVQFWGGVECASEQGLSYEQLKSCYDLVILAVGCNQNKSLALPGMEHPSVSGALEVVSWYNGHPDFARAPTGLKGPNLAIIGHGNVALDLARIMAKTEQELAASDMPEAVIKTLSKTHFERIYIIGRQGPLQARFTPSELAELADLSNAHPFVNQAYLALDDTLDQGALAKTVEKNLALFKQFSQAHDGGKGTRLEFLFHMTPTAWTENDSDSMLLTLEPNPGCPQDLAQSTTLTVNSLITAIGYQHGGLLGVPYDAGTGRIQHDQGMVEPGVYSCGWCSRGAQGVIPANRQEAQALVKKIVSDVEQGIVPVSHKPGRKALMDALNVSGITPYTFSEWQILDQLEINAATPPKPREKLCSYQAIDQALQRSGCGPAG